MVKVIEGVVQENHVIPVIPFNVVNVLDGARILEGSDLLAPYMEMF